MAKPNHQSRLVDKSVASILSAIEIYNKPDFSYREEVFSILLVNAWELLLKARILQQSKNKLQSIQVPEKTKTKSGTPTKRFYPSLNRSGNFKTIDIFKALEHLQLDKTLRANLESVIEIRDNSIHFYNKDKLLDKKIQEICTASLKSYLTCIADWFRYDMSKYNFYLMPISFYHPFEIESRSVNSLARQEKNLLKYFKEKENKNPYSEEAIHNFSLKLTTRFEKGDVGISIRRGSSGVSISFSEDDLFKNKFNITYRDLVVNCKKRYSNFSPNQKFNNIMKEVKTRQDVLCKKRYFDPIKKTGEPKIFYCSEVYKELDKHYKKLS
jgi:hypothetical protein